MRHLAIALYILVGVTACDRTPKPDEVPPPQTQNASTTQGAETTETAAQPEAGALEIMPLQHASMLLTWNDLTIAVDPVQGALDAAPGDEPQADLILVTDIHGDHFDIEAVKKLRREGGVVVVPQAVADQAGDSLEAPTIVPNGGTKELFDSRIQVTGVAMYNIERKRDSGEPYHVKGRGNGYVLQLGSQRVYISGDTECIPEMKALENIDVAFVCMNLPYTMTPEEAAGCIAEFEPRKLVPYHYRGQDPTTLDELLAGEPITIEHLDWYPTTDTPASK